MPHPKGGYKVAGISVPSVTTVLSRYKDSGPLMYWAFEQGKAAERGEISSLYDKRDEAGNAGTLAHALVQARLELSPDPDMTGYSDEVIAKAFQGYENYVTWEKNSRIVIQYQELELTSPTYMFGGCIDAVGIDADGRTCLIDWKTSNAVYPDYRIQLAAYAQLWNENHPDIPLSGGYHLCRFSKEYGDFSHHYWSDLSEEWEYFKLLLAAYILEKKLKRRT